MIDLHKPNMRTCALMEACCKQCDRVVADTISGGKKDKYDRVVADTISAREQGSSWVRK